MTRKACRGKNQRAEELLTHRDREKIHELYRVNLLEIDLICERFGLDEDAVKTILASRVKKREPVWQVRWDDSSGMRHVQQCESFKAAREYHAALVGVEWSRVERC